MFSTGSPYALTVSVKVPVTTTAYTTGLCIAPAFVLSNWARGAKLASLLTRIRLYDPQNNNVAMTIKFFNQMPVSPFTANGTYATQLLAADLPNLVTEVSIPAGSGVGSGAAVGSGIGAYQLVELNPYRAIPVVVAGTSPIYGLLVAAASVTYAAAGNLTLDFDLLRS